MNDAQILKTLGEELREGSNDCQHAV